ncbi:MAG: hypothetical protein J7L07_11070 [Candidatus Odinarchaeota archaeon]|nr:hypothetical protein [Candidatus Odinarchaeota archaeon]
MGIPSRFNIPVSQDEIKACGGRPKLKDTAVSFIKAILVDKLIIAEDLDDRMSDDLIPSWENSLRETKSIW